VILTTLIVGGP